jgi:hypothetical protein
MKNFENVNYPFQDGRMDNNVRLEDSNILFPLQKEGMAMAND